jgi:hypothetical protein
MRRLLLVTEHSNRVGDHRYEKSDHIRRRQNPFYCEIGVRYSCRRRKVCPAATFRETKRLPATPFCKHAAGGVLVRAAEVRAAKTVSRGLPIRFWRYTAQ